MHHEEYSLILGYPKARELLAGIFQVDELLRHKLRNSSIKDHVEIIARIDGETERRLIEIYNPQ